MRSLLIRASLSLLVLGLLSASPLLAATVTVTSTADSGSGSLRAAVVFASPGDTIDFQVAGTITLTSGQILIDKDLTISGPGESLVSIAGNGTDRLLEILAGNSVTISGLHFQGNLPFQPAIEFGGGILNNGDLEIEDCRFMRFWASYGSALANFGAVNVLNSTFEENSTDNSCGGAFYNNGAGASSIMNSSFVRNDAQVGDGDFVADICNLGGELSVVGSTAASFSNWGDMNLVDSLIAGGCTYTNGGVLTVERTSMSVGRDEGCHPGLNNSGILNMIDSSLSNAESEGGGGLRNAGSALVLRSTISDHFGTSGAVVVAGITNTGDMWLINSTVSRNRAYISGILNAPGAMLYSANSTILNNETSNPGRETILVFNEGVFILRNSLLADLGSPGLYTPVCAGPVPIVSLGSNIDSDGTCGLTGPGDIQADPLLGPLTNNGGYTATHTPLPGSPAIDAVSAADCLYDDDWDPITPDVLLPFDQRGVVRPQGVGCDIGAVETLPIVTAHRVIDCDAGQELATLMHGETFVLDLNDPGSPSCVGIGVLTDASNVVGDGAMGHDYTPAAGETVAEPYEGENFAPYAFTDELGWAVLDEIAACNCDHPERGDLTYPGTHTLTSIPCSADTVSWVAGDKATQCAAAGGAVGATFTTQLVILPEPAVGLMLLFGAGPLAALASRRSYSAPSKAGTVVD